jgi:uncharacterized protein (DUF983 family)
MRTCEQCGHKYRLETPEKGGAGQSALLQARCPHCGGTESVPESAVQKVRACPACKNEYRLAPPKKGEAGYSAHVGLQIAALTALGVGLMVAFGCLYLYLALDHFARERMRKEAEGRAALVAPAVVWAMPGEKGERKARESNPSSREGTPR